MYCDKIGSILGLTYINYIDISFDNMNLIMHHVDIHIRICNTMLVYYTNTRYNYMYRHCIKEACSKKVFITLLSDLNKSGVSKCRITNLI